MIRESLSKSIDILRAPMALLIICVHADFTKNFSYLGKDVVCHKDIGYHVVNWISHSLSDIAVPLFFIISGILYYSSYNKYTYLELIKKRIKTLMVPYILWNLIFYAVFFLNDYTITEFLEGLWCLPQKKEVVGVFTQPWDGPLWFLRDLIVVFFLSPIIVFFIHKIGFPYIFILLFSYITKIIPWYIVPGLSITSLLMFSIGICLQRTNKDWQAKLIRHRILLFSVFFCLSILCYIYTLQEYSLSYVYNILHSLAIFSGIGAAFSISGGYKKNQVLIRKFSCHTFIIFASHTLFLTNLIKVIMLPFGHEIKSWQILIIYFSSVILTFVITHLIGVFISKYHFLNKLLAGNR